MFGSMPSARIATNGADGASIFGRERELDRLGDLVDGLPGRGAPLLLRGEAGIGKSTLLAAAVRRTEEAGTRVLRTTGMQSEAQLPCAVPPLMLKTEANPDGLQIIVFDEIRAGVAADRSQFFEDLSEPFYGTNRPGAEVSQGFRDAFWPQGMRGGLKSELDCIEAFSEIDFTEDLKRFDVPTLIIHGDDQIVPIVASALASSKLVKDSTLEVYEGAPHGLADTHKDRLNADLLAFLRE
jgi:pimeloyl-ACP methyl ester carboxylesterase